jgi:hypothetical protein
VLKKIVDLQIPISAPWLWWDRLKTTNHFNIVPGATLTGEYVDLFRIPLRLSERALEIRPVRPSI